MNKQVVPQGSNLPETHKSLYSVTVLQHAHLSVGSHVSVAMMWMHVDSELDLMEFLETCFLFNCCRIR